MTNSITWRVVGPAKVKTNWTGRRFAHFQGVGTLDDAEPRVNRLATELHRTVTVILRHDRNGCELVTGREARALALRALERAGATEVHQTIDPDEEQL